MRFWVLAAMACLLGLPAWAAPANVVFRHIIVVIQENRTPDNLFGSAPNFEPGVDIATSGVNSLGQTIPLTAEILASCYDMGHKHEEFEAMLNEGADQELLVVPAGCTAPANPEFKFVDNSTGTVQPYFDIATQYSFSNRMFQTNQGASFLAHQFLFGGTSQPSTESPLFAADSVGKGEHAFGCTAPPNTRIYLIDGYGNENTNKPIYPCFEHPTLSDVLDNAAITWRYYGATPDTLWLAPNAIQHICVPVPSGNGNACTGPAFTNGQVVENNPAQVLTDVQSCNLASVSWVTPNKEESDHSQVNTGLGPAWVASIVNAVGQQAACPDGETYWNDTAILIVWDDWGGWYDHVRPFAINQQPVSPAQWGDGYTYGFRVPFLVVSAYTPNHLVDNTVHDFGSILYFIEHNFALGFIGPGDTIYSNYADYQAAMRGDDLSEFFLRKQPRPFKPIKTDTSIEDFIHAPRSIGSPDDE
jgi:phospholipase C